MKPVSALYYIKENKLRCALLAFMFVLTYIAYIGGLYIYNVPEIYEYHEDAMKKYAIIYADPSDTDFSKLNAAMEKIEKDDRITVIKQGYVSSISISSVMGLHHSFFQGSFRSVEDFKTFCGHMGIKCDYSNLKAGSMIASQMVVNNRGMELGKVFAEEDKYDRMMAEYTLDAITDQEGPFVYYIDDRENENYILLSTGMSEEEFEDYTAELKQKYDIFVNDRAYLMRIIDEQLNGMIVIYVFILILLAVVMAVTINAAFVGMYIHRKPEFAIYRAIGIGKREIAGKIASELLAVDAIGLVSGGVLMMLILYLLNNLALYPKGLMLFYYNNLALFGLLLCNLAVLAPMIITRCRQMIRADICEY